MQNQESKIKILDKDYIIRKIAGKWEFEMVFPKGTKINLETKMIDIDTFDPIVGPKAQDFIDALIEIFRKRNNKS